jgi:uncharacterized RDD family membrane protein YckC
MAAAMNDAKVVSTDPKQVEEAAVAAFPELARELRAGLEALVADLSAVPDAGVSAASGTDTGAVRRTLARVIAERTIASMSAVLTDPSRHPEHVAAMSRLLVPEDAFIESASPHEPPAGQESTTSVPRLDGPVGARIQHIVEQAIAQVLLGAPPQSLDFRAPTRAETAVVWRRLLAYLVDLCFPLAASLLAGLVIAIAGGEVSTPMSAFIWYAAVALMGVMNAFLISTSGVSPGKLCLGVAVVDADDGARIDRQRALSREFLGRFASTFLFGIGSMAALAHPLRRTWGDRMAGTAVVRMRRRPGWAAWGYGASACCVLLVVGYLPAIMHVNQLDADAATVVNAHLTDLIVLQDSIHVLAVRPVPDSSAMIKDLRAILDLAPTASPAIAESRARMRDLVQQSRLIKPWNAGANARLDSVYILMSASLHSAQDYARFALLAQGDSTRNRANTNRLAEYALSDYQVDREYWRRLLNQGSGEVSR